MIEAEKMTATNPKMLTNVSRRFEKNSKSYKAIYVRNDIDTNVVKMRIAKVIGEDFLTRMFSRTLRSSLSVNGSELLENI